MQSLTTALVNETQAQYDSVKGTGAEAAARRNLGYLSVAAKLIDPSFSVPAAVQTEVNAERAQIAAPVSIGAAAVMRIGDRYP